VHCPGKGTKMPPFQYLGNIDECLICLQKAEIKKDNLRTLSDLQKLLGNINWLRPSLKLTTDSLSPLFQLLKGDPHFFKNLWRMPDMHWLS
jgi:hypothetical protein